MVAISGDLTQRARAGEFQRAAAFVRDARRVSRVITVPGNHDVAWWKAPLGFGHKPKVYDVFTLLETSQTLVQFSTIFFI